MAQPYPCHQIVANAFSIAGQVHSICDVHTAFRDISWRTEETEGGGKISYAILGGDRETGEITVLVAMERCDAPRHRHLPGGLYGELIIGIAGELTDETDDGQPVTILPGMILAHAGDTEHAPRARTFWLGVYHQPHGMELI